ncbi:MAG: recombinase family protein [Bryobacteraceae bacterium]
MALISVAESLDTGSAAGRLVITIMGAVSQWEREAIGDRTRDALRHKRGKGERVGNIAFGYRLSTDGLHLEQDPAEQAALGRSSGCAPPAVASAPLRVRSTEAVTARGGVCGPGCQAGCCETAIHRLTPPIMRSYHWGDTLA